jgi:hypothetical protein
MTLLVIYQSDGFALVEKSAWERHLGLAKAMMLYDGQDFDAYEKSFRVSEITDEDRAQIIKLFDLKVNTTPEIESVMGRFSAVRFEMQLTEGGIIVPATSPMVLD